MKVNFLIGNPVIACASNWQEIKKYQHDQLIPDEETYIVFKSLEKNKDFEAEIMKSRKRLNVPLEGITFEDYLRRNNFRAKPEHTHEEINSYLYFVRHYPKEIIRLKRRLRINLMIERQLQDLILGGFVLPYYRGLGYYPDREVDHEGDEIPDGDVESVSIYISKKTSRNELIKFIEDNWEGINKYISKFPEEGKFYISERDLRIVELRDDSNLTYNEVANKIVEELGIDNVEGNINEDSVKTSYQRAKQKITSLAYKRTKVT